MANCSAVKRRLHPHFIAGRGILQGRLFTVSENSVPRSQLSQAVAELSVAAMLSAVQIPGQQVPGDPNGNGEPAMSFRDGSLIAS